MATSVQTLPVTRGPTQNFRSPFPSSPLSSLCGMGSVGSLVEKPDVSPTKGNRAVPQVRPRQTNGLLKKGLTQRELLNYLNITRWVLLQSSRYLCGTLRWDVFWLPALPNRKEPKAGPSGDGKRDVIGGLVEDDVFAKVYSKDGTEIDLTKNSLPSGGKYEKVNVRELRLYI